MYVRYHITRIKSEIIKAQKARKTLGKLNWAIQLSSFLSLFLGIFLTMKKGKLYIDLQLRIWRIQICQKEKYFFSDIIWLLWWRTTCKFNILLKGIVNNVSCFPFFWLYLICKTLIWAWYGVKMKPWKILFKRIVKYVKEWKCMSNWFYHAQFLSQTGVLDKPFGNGLWWYFMNILIVTNVNYLSYLYKM